MNTPTEAQLNDPKWWDENAPEGATHLAWLNHGWTWWKPGEKKCGMLWHRRFSEWQERYDESIAKHRRPTKPEPQEWDGEGWTPIGCQCERFIGDEVYRVTVVAHFDGEVVVHQEDAAPEYTGVDPGYLRPPRTKEQRDRDQAVNAALLLNEYPSGEGSGGLMSRRAFCEALYDAGMLRKAGEK